MIEIKDEREKIEKFSDLNIGDFFALGSTGAYDYDRGKNSRYYIKTSDQESGGNCIALGDNNRHSFPVGVAVVRLKYANIEFTDSSTTSKYVNIKDSTSSSYCSVSDIAVNDFFIMSNTYLGYKWDGRLCLRIANREGDDENSVRIFDFSYNKEKSVKPNIIAFKLDDSDIILKLM